VLATACIGPTVVSRTGVWLDVVRLPAVLTERLPAASAELLSGNRVGGGGGGGGVFT